MARSPELLFPSSAPSTTQIALAGSTQVGVSFEPSIEEIFATDILESTKGHLPEGQGALPDFDSDVLGSVHHPLRHARARTERLQNVLSPQIGSRMPWIPVSYPYYLVGKLDTGGSASLIGPHHIISANHVLKLDDDNKIIGPKKFEAGAYGEPWTTTLSEWYEVYNPKAHTYKIKKWLTFGPVFGNKDGYLDFAESAWDFAIGILDEDPGLGYTGYRCFETSKYFRKPVCRVGYDKDFYQGKGYQTVQCSIVNHATAPIIGSGPSFWFKPAINYTFYSAMPGIQPGASGGPVWDWTGFGPHSPWPHFIGVASTSHTIEQALPAFSGGPYMCKCIAVARNAF